MLDSRPVRAQAPIVLGRKWTLAAARISDASARVIQSAAAIAYSAAGSGAFASPARVEGAGVDSPGEEPSFDSAVVARGADRLARSFFAQPDPLKTMAGGTNALRIVPSAPQLEQNRGPSSLTPWITSRRRSQALQT
jgi:hypothetical protein